MRHHGRGFDCIVGNPPFAGKNTILASSGHSYIEYLKAVHEGSHGNSDLVAHFFRRAFGSLRPSGTLGFVATNTIAQGDTRSTGLRWICRSGGAIYAATRRRRWPGTAAVIVSVVHVRRGPVRHEAISLDGRHVERISAFLFHQGSDDDPVRLNANADKSFEGTTVLGMGFTFDDNNPDATSTTEMRELIAKNGSNAERICPYLGGEELNSTPTQAHYRYIINFENMSELEARRWPDLMGILEAKVRGTRGKHSTAEWWHFERPRHELYAAIRELPRVLSIARVGQAMAFAFLRAETVYSEQLVVFAFESNAPFAALQSRPHEVWARFLGSSMKDDLRYTPSDCFETFPFPDGWETNPALESTGKAYYDFRAALMVKNNEGLTKTYNRFHDPDETDGDIVKLRELHAAMDRAVLDAFGWADVRPTCEFLLDYEEADDDDAPSGRRKKKKPWRYRWPDDIRDEVLARLLDLNAQRAKEESAASTGATPPSPSASGKKAPRRSKKKPATSSETQTGLFGKETK